MAARAAGRAPTRRTTGYHDEEWGRPVADERGLYERLCLEGFQSGLSWLTILRKRENFRAAFAGFEPERVAEFGEADVNRLLADAGIVRHRGKIEAAIANARATVALREAGRAAAGARLVVPRRRPAPRSRGDWLAKTPGSEALSKELRKAGFRFVGPTTVYAAMQACGVVNDHLATCPWRAIVEEARGACLTIVSAPCSRASRPRTPTSAPATSRASSGRARSRRTTGQFLFRSSPRRPTARCSSSAARAGIRPSGSPRACATWAVASSRSSTTRRRSRPGAPTSRRRPSRLGRARPGRRLRDATRDRRRLRPRLPRRREGATTSGSSSSRADKLEPGAVVIADNMLSHEDMLGAYSRARRRTRLSRA